MRQWLAVGLLSTWTIVLLLTFVITVTAHQPSHPDSYPFFRPTPRPTPNIPSVDSSETNQSDDDDNDDSTPKSAIEGIVTDLSTGKPGAGVRVQIDEIVVKTDTAGHYSLTGLTAGTMTVQLLLDQVEGVPNQDTITVRLDGLHTEVVNLAFRSAVPPTPTATLIPPQHLPETGGITIKNH